MWLPSLTTACLFSEHRCHRSVGLVMPDVALGGDDSGGAAAYMAFLERQAEVFKVEREASLARLGLHPGQVILDAGCGPGTDTFSIETLVSPGGRVVGVDSSEAMIGVARQRGAQRASGAEFLVGDVRSLEVAADTFDLARCVLLRLHVDDPGPAVAEMARVVRPGGRVICVDVDHQMDAVDAGDLELAERVFRGRFAQVQNPRIGRQLRGLFIAAGLVDVDIEVLTKVSRSWGEFNALADPTGPSLFDQAVARGDASRAEVDALEADLLDRHADGRFFACAVRMRCSGAKPE